MKTIIVTGSVGTGKTTLAKKLYSKTKFVEQILSFRNTKKTRSVFLYKKCKAFLCKQKTSSIAQNRGSFAIAKKPGFKYVDVNKLIKENRLSSGYDRKRKCKIIDIKKLNNFLINLIKNSKKDLIIDSHLSHYLPQKYVDLCIVTKCSLKELNKRLKNRGYDENKIKENVECEIFDICLNEAKEAEHKVLVIDTTKGINISEISKKVANIK